jgi:hypothetical protein
MVYHGHLLLYMIYGTRRTGFCLEYTTTRICSARCSRVQVTAIDLTPTLESHTLSLGVVDRSWEGQPSGSS